MTDKPAGKVKRWIRPLPERLVNKIAAGEVIERPAAVLKELVENSIDAGAGKIEIIIEKSGTKLISVIDNGCGIEPDQVEIAFSRHATSKISDFRDLESLTSYGFRGEALPSIASISRTRMLTKHEDYDSGTQIIVEGGVVQSVKPAAAPTGTTVEVRDLFFNTPARRKFLKTETTEARYLSRNAVALALGAPGVAFSCNMNGRKIFDVSREDADLSKRTASLLLGKPNEKLFEVISDTDLMSVSAYLSYPSQTRQNRYGLYIFINDRFINSPTMVHAVTSGYGEMLPRGQFPIGAVFLKLDPQKVDVNVHPTKAEVRLSDERLVHDMLYQAVKRTIHQTSDAHSPTVKMEGEEETKKGHARSSLKVAIRRANQYDPQKKQVDSQVYLDALYGKREERDEVSDFPQDSDRSATTPVTETKDIPDKTAAQYRSADGEPISYLGQVAELYLIFKKGDRILIIDQHTAHERVLYEANLKSIEGDNAVSQNLLFPVNIEMSPERFALYEETRDILKSAGFAVEPFGYNVVILNAVPTSLSRKSPEKVFIKVLEDIENMQGAGFDLKKAIAQSMACRAAIMAGDRLSSEEAIGLYKQLMRSENRHSCPHGRPIILKISKDELDAKFGRK